MHECALRDGSIEPDTCRSCVPHELDTSTDRNAVGIEPVGGPDTPSESMPCSSRKEGEERGNMFYA